MKLEWHCQQTGCKIHRKEDVETLMHTKGLAVAQDMSTSVHVCYCKGKHEMWLVVVEEGKKEPATACCQVREGEEYRVWTTTLCGCPSCKPVAERIIRWSFFGGPIFSNEPASKPERIKKLVDVAPPSDPSARPRVEPTRAEVISFKEMAAEVKAAERLKPRACLSKPHSQQREILEKKWHKSIGFDKVRDIYKEEGGE